MRHAGFVLLAVTLLMAGAVTTAQANSLLFVADFDSGAGRIQRFDGTTGAFVDSHTVPGLTGMGFPGGMTVGPDGNLYVSDKDNSAVDRFSGTTGVFLNTFITSIAGLDGPTGLKFGPGGVLYIANSGTFSHGGNAFISRYNGTTGSFIDQFVPPPSPPNPFTPTDLVFGPDANLYVSDSLNGIDRFNGTTKAFNQFVGLGSPPTTPDNPIGLVFGTDGNLYVADNTANAILRYQGGTGTALGQFNNGTLVQPVDLTFGPDGNLYVTDSQGVERLDKNTGVVINFIPAGANLTNPQFLVFTQPPPAVPEPSTFILFAMGTIALGLRRRFARAIAQK